MLLQPKIVKTVNKWHASHINLTYRKPPSISPGLIHFRKRFLMGLYQGGLIYGEAFHGRSFVLVINKSDINKSVINRKINMY
jgi:hypothetical protein